MLRVEFFVVDAGFRCAQPILPLLSLFVECPVESVNVAPNAVKLPRNALLHGPDIPMLEGLVTHHRQRGEGIVRVHLFLGLNFPIQLTMKSLQAVVELDETLRHEYRLPLAHEPQLRCKSKGS
jgi:hypothetical protein